MCAQQNIINKVVKDLTIDPGGSGDSFTQFNINSVGKFRIGVDDDASDAYKISSGSALGTNDTFVVQATGEITKPLQPAVSAQVGVSALNITGDGSVFNIILGHENFDQNSDFDGTSTFTAPITGIYEFCVNLSMYECDNTSTSADITLQVNGSVNYRLYYVDPSSLIGLAAGANIVPRSLLFILKMTASDTLVCKLTVSGGAKTVDLVTTVAATPQRNILRCSLVC